MSAEREISRSSPQEYSSEICYIWTYGDKQDIIDRCSKIQKQESRPDIEDRKIKINGWLATVEHIEIDNRKDRVVIFINDEVATDHILADYSDLGSFAHYLIGELNINTLDGYDNTRIKDVIDEELKYVEEKWNRYTFRLAINLNVLEHLGINLYSNVPAVLSEIVANAWDADASKIRVAWDKAAGRIVIQDDGIGMTPDEIKERFLNVGYRRRDGQPGPTPEGRHPMGRKGIGKLSLFSIANTVRIETIKEGIKSAFQMKLDEIREQIRKEEGSGTYEPTILPVDGIDFPRGTKITLSELRKKQTIGTTRALKKRVARRFSIIGEKHGFRVYVDGDEVTPSDRDYYDKIRYIWTYGDQRDVIAQCSKVEKKEDRTACVESEGIAMTGWLATVGQVGYLKDEEGDNLNRIAIFVRGKLAQEDILTDFAERGVYASYLIGELHVDGLDEYDGPEAGTNEDDDAATSSRQKIVEDDERYRKLRKIIGKELKHIQNRWADHRSEEGSKKALEIPEVKDWMEGLKPNTRKKAKKWLGRLNRIRIDEMDEQKQLIRQAVLAFEFHRIKENLEKLENIADDNLQATLDIFEDLDDLEFNLYGQIVHQRIHIIRILQEKVDENALERAIQEYLFDRLWLLDPSWERTEGTELMEKRVDKLFEDVDASLTNEEKRGRLDIAYRKTAGQHVIIELKRPERVVSISEIVKQLEKYTSGMLKLLRAQGATNEPVEIVLLLGKAPAEWASEDGKDRMIRTLSAYNARIVFYDQLLKDAYSAYADYMEKRKIVARLGKVMQAIDDYAPPAETETAD